MCGYLKAGAAKTSCWKCSRAARSFSKSRGGNFSFTWRCTWGVRPLPPRLPRLRSFLGCDSSRWFLPNTVSSILPNHSSTSISPRRNFLLQLFKPVQHHIDLRRRRLPLLAGLEHQEALPVGSHVVVRERCRGRLERSFKEHLRFTHRKGWLRHHAHCHYLVAAAVEQLPPIRIPHWLGTAFR